MEYRLQTAKEKLHSAEILLASGQYKDSVGRSYYAMFSAIRAILALDKVDFSKHAAVIAYFQKEYITYPESKTYIEKLMQKIGL